MFNGNDPPPSNGDVALIQRLEHVVATDQSMQEIERWLSDQPWVEDVWTEDYVLKTNPPRRVLRPSFA